jgi:hypothetical protein
MKNANLLIPIQALQWGHDDLSDKIEDFEIAFNLALDAKDKIFNANETFYSDIVQKLSLWPIAKEHYPWLRQKHHQLIANTILWLRSTPANSNSCQELDVEFDAENNGHLSIGENSKSHREVYDDYSWHNLHINYLTNYPEYIEWPDDSFLPNTSFSKRLICNFVKINFPKFKDEKDEIILAEFETNLVRQCGKTHKGEMIELATSIAKANYYKFDQSLSSSESRRCGRERRIFSAIKNANYQYLSLDHENFLFEACDSSGKQCGAINFIGVKKEDSKADHSIEIG